MMKRFGWWVLCLCLGGVAFAEDPPPPSPTQAEDQAQQQQINQMAALLQQHRLPEAMALIDTMNAAADKKIAEAAPRQVFTARTLPETLLYPIQAANAHQVNGAVVFSWVWSQGYFFKGYILNEMGRTGEAQPYLERAIALAPMNSQYLLELGNLHIKQHNFDAALKDFQTGEEAARAYAPEGYKNGDLGKAWRGTGYVLVEQNKLDEAEKMYRQCLDLDKNDQRAANELKYVLAQKAKAGGTSP
jgi:tetratricopeptide (TPR) repeat protein